MPEIYAPADVFMIHNGVKVYLVYKNDDKDCGIVRDYFYSFSENSSDFADEAGFDVREDVTAFDVIKDKSYSELMADDRILIKRCIAEGIDSGELDEMIDMGDQIIPDRFTNFYQHCDEAWTDTSPNTNNDRCPKCNAEIEPYESQDIEVDPTSFIPNPEASKLDLAAEIKSIIALCETPHWTTNRKYTIAEKAKSILKELEVRGI